MKTKLINKETKIKVDQEKFADYAFLISQCLSIPPKEGFDAMTMKKRLSVLSALENLEVDQEIELKAEEVLTVKQCVREMKWSVLHKDISDMCDVVESL